jgi:hypothetical protein
MACGSCGGARNRQNTNWVVTRPDGTKKTFTAADGGISAARIEAGKVKGSTLKAVQAPKTA